MERDPSREQRARYELEQLNARGMRLLTGGLTSEADAFLIAVAAVLLISGLYPLIGGWSLLAFPLVFLGAVLLRGHLKLRSSGRQAP